MKSKYYLALILVGILPVIAIMGVYFWMLFNQAPAPKAPPVDMAAVQVAIPSLKTQVDTMASSMSSAIEQLNNDIPNLYAHNTDKDLDTFVKTHQGVTGIVILSQAGKVVRTIPASPPLITDPSYGTSEEFQKTASKLKDNGGKPYLFYTLKLGYPAFIFTMATSTQTIAEAVVSLANFFRGIDAHSGEIFLLEAGSGNIFYHSNPAKWGAPFNPNQEPWLDDIQKNLEEKKGGYAFNPDKISAVYSPVFASFGIVHMFPSSILQPPSPAPVANTRPSLENLPQLIQTPMSLAVIISLGWILIIGSIFFGIILSPLRKASAAVLAAVNSGSLPTETVHKFGKDEIGRMVQAVATLLTKLDKEKQQIQEEKEEALRRGRGEVESKTKDAADQVAEAQRQVQAARNESNDKNQLLNDKLKELDALKGMSEGLRNQTEQAKAEIGKLKGQAATAEEAKADVEKQLAETKGQLESQFKEMESKLLLAMGASSAIKVSQVRAAAIRTMSEELKTTLGIIKGYVSSALGTTQGGISEKQQEFLGMVINRSARLEKFINDLVDIYQVEIEQQDAKYEEVNLASEIEGLAFNFQAQAEVKNIKMKVEVKPNVPKVPIVRRRFNQLWNILYLQMIKDAPRGSTIPITVETLGDHVKVTLQDPGLNVVPESLPKLFDEFYDPKHPASPQLAGTGLKFALVKTILAAHGGGAVAEKADPGTRILLTFATKIKKPGETPAPSPAAPKAPGPLTASPSVTAPGLKPGVTPTLGTTPGLPKPPSLGVPGIAKPAPPPISIPGMPKPAVPGMAPPAAPKPVAPGGPGALDALLSGKIPSVTAPGIKPPVPATPPVAPSAPKPPISIPGMPSAPAPGAATPPSVPGLKPPTAMGGMLDSLMDKKPAAPGIPPAGAPPAVPKPAAPPVAPPTGAPGMPAALKPPIPIPGMPAAAPKPVAPPVGAPGMMPPPVPKPPMPGAPGAPPALGVPAAPKVIPTGLKPVPTPGVLNLDGTDGPKLDAGAPPTKPPMPPSPGVPGAPPMGAKPPAPGVPPGGLNAAPPPPKKDEGELIE